MDNARSRSSNFHNALSKVDEIKKHCDELKAFVDDLFGDIKRSVEELAKAASGSSYQLQRKYISAALEDELNQRGAAMDDEILLDLARIIGRDLAEQLHDPTKADRDMATKLLRETYRGLKDLDHTTFDTKLKNQVFQIVKGRRRY